MCLGTEMMSEVVVQRKYVGLHVEITPCNSVTVVLRLSLCMYPCHTDACSSRVVHSQETWLRT